MEISYPATGLHLYQPVRYRASDGSWHTTFNNALQHSGRHLTWDSAAILSMLSFGYICGDRTLIKEINRQPWLSEIGPDGEPILLPVPAHQRYWQTEKAAAANLRRLLCDEILLACQGRKEIYVLLSGGLDSRVAAGIVSQLYREGKLAVKPVCITWGLPNSRDVIYAKRTAEILRLEWIYVSLEPQDLLKNIKASAEKLGAMVSPAHLHRMQWFENVDPNAIVLAASYGDMVGRAEFSGLQLLELDYLKPTNSFDLLSPSAFSVALYGLNADLRALHARTPQEPRYVLCEHEMHAHYTRGMLAQAMGLINNYCTLYQVFTHPKVYAYMWSLHPAMRTDAIYAALLENLEPKLARLPWARTNQALRGKTEGADQELLASFNDYNNWISGPLYDEFLRIIQSDWLTEAGLFQVEQEKQLCESIKRKSIDPRYYDAYDVFVWLASLKRFMEWCKRMDIQIAFEQTISELAIPAPAGKTVGKMRAALRSFPPIYQSVKFVRRLYYRFLSIIEHPPVFQ